MNGGQIHSYDVLVQPWKDSLSQFGLKRMLYRCDVQCIGSIQTLLDDVISSYG